MIAFHTFDKRNNKFCSQSCAATYSNLHRDPEIAKRQGITIKKYYSLNPSPPKVKEYCSFSCCIICDSVIQNKHRKTCSPECRTKLNIKNGTKYGRISAAKRVRRSKDEIALCLLCESHYNKVTNNDTSIANGWDADILIHDHKVAIMWNGPWHYKEMGFSNHSLKQVQNRDAIKINEFIKAGWSVEIFEDKYYTPNSAFEQIKAKYHI